MKRILLRVAYDGTNYHGYQIQSGCATIEGELNKAVSELTGEVNIELIGGSRTDSGVHALDNVCVFDTEASIPADKYIFALNQRLPEDIRITSSEEVAPDFHPRHCDSVKTYEYRIHTGAVPNPLKRLYSYHTFYNLDIKLMNEACKFIIGEHDFSAFCAAGAQVDSKIRTVYSCEIIAADNVCEKESVESSNAWCSLDKDIVIRVSGNGFLYNMVRIIAGTLIEVGRGHIAPTEVEGIIASCDRTKAGPTAPACGLSLQKYLLL